MTVLTGATLSEVGIDAVALKPTEVRFDRAMDLDVDAITIDYEGRTHVPGPDTLRSLGSTFETRLTVPVRADGFDPRGDDSLYDDIPDSLSYVLVAGNRAYLTERERRRAVAPRLAEAAERIDQPWVGTEGIERLALAVGGTQFELLAAGTRRSVRALRATGFDGQIAVYAPTALTDDDAQILDAVGGYTARRRPVRERLPENAPTDSTATGKAREILLDACREYALVGSPETVADRIGTLRDAGVDHIVGYPARGLDPLLK